MSIAPLPDACLAILEHLERVGADGGTWEQRATLNHLREGGLRDREALGLLFMGGLIAFHLERPNGGRSFREPIRGGDPAAVRAVLNGELPGGFFISGDGLRLLAERRIAGDGGAPSRAEMVVKDQPAAEEPLQLTREQVAIALRTSHPEWSETRLARELGVHRSTLYTWKNYVAVRDRMRDISHPERARADLPSGSKDGRSGAIEAVD